jgi:hypothetical protein
VYIKDGEDKHMINKTLVKNMPHVKWKEIPPVKGPDPQGLDKPTLTQKQIDRRAIKAAVDQARRVFP